MNWLIVLRKALWGAFLAGAPVVVQVAQGGGATDEALKAGVVAALAGVLLNGGKNAVKHWGEGRDAGGGG